MHGEIYSLIHFVEVDFTVRLFVHQDLDILKKYFNQNKHYTAEIQC